MKTLFDSINKTFVGKIIYHMLSHIDIGKIFIKPTLFIYLKIHFSFQNGFRNLKLIQIHFLIL